VAQKAASAFALCWGVTGLQLGEVFSS